MKIFIFAIAALILSTIVVIFSLYYVSHSISTVSDLLSALPDTMAENTNKKTSENVLGCLDDLTARWKSKTAILSLFISHKELDDVDSFFATLRASIESNDPGHYASSLTALKEKLKKLSASEKISLSSIL